MRSCKLCIFFNLAEDLDGKERFACRLHPLTVPTDMEREGEEWDVYLVDTCGCAKGRPKDATCADCDHARPLSAGGRTSVLRVECHRNPPSWVGDTFARAFVLKTETCGHWQNLRMGEFDE